MRNMYLKDDVNVKGELMKMKTRRKKVHKRHNLESTPPFKGTIHWT
jgi:hypothetical protein